LSIQIPTAEVFAPLLEPSRYKGAWGGRGSGKSHFFAEMLVDDHYRNPGFRSVCIREHQKSLKDSAKRLIEDKIQVLGLGTHFEVQHDQIRSRGSGLILFQGMQDHTAESIKSLEGFNRAWIEEAQTLSERSLSMLRPTIRAESSEIWASWNPRRKIDAIDNFLRVLKPEGAIVVKANWRDNPWFPEVLEDERLLDLDLYPDRYDHIWEGDYAKAFEGAYFAIGLLEARQEKRIGHVAKDPLLPLRAFIDIGGAGKKADAFVIWIVQWVGQEIRVLDYYEAVGQPIGAHVDWLRRKKYHNAVIYLPHDGSNANGPMGLAWARAFYDAEFNVEDPIPNQGAGAAAIRVEAVRRIFNRCWFNEATTEAGRDALGFYHERKDETRNVGLGPDHDWSSHAADAFGLMAIVYEPQHDPKISDLYDRGGYADSTRSSVTGY
jgi:phage terminase large subunit